MRIPRGMDPLAYILPKTGSSVGLAQPRVASQAPRWDRLLPSGVQAMPQGGLKVDSLD